MVEACQCSNQASIWIAGNMKTASRKENKTYYAFRVETLDPESAEASRHLGFLCIAVGGVVAQQRQVEQAPLVPRLGPPCSRCVAGGYVWGEASATNSRRSDTHHGSANDRGRHSFLR